MHRKTARNLSLVSALVAGLLVVATPPPTPAAATGPEGWSALGTGVTGGRVFQLVRASDGTLYAGGQFTAAGGVANTKGVASWNPTTSAWSALAGGVTVGDVYALGLDEASTPARLYVGGNLTGVSNLPGTPTVNRLVVWDGTAFSGITGLTNGALATWQGVEEIAVVASNKVFVGGGFEGTANAYGFGVVSGSALAAVSNGLGGPNFVNGMTPDGAGGVLIGGQFTSVNGGATAANRVARWDGTTWSGFSATPATSGPTGATNTNLVAAVASTSAGVVIGGNFGSVANNSTPVPNTKALARWNGTAWESMGAVVGTVIEELRVIGDYLYVGGEFTSIAGVAALNIARYKLSTSTWEAVTHQCFNGVNGVVRSIIDTGLGDGSIYVGGGFTDAGGVAAADGVAMYTPSTQGCGGGIAPPQLTAAPEDFRVTGVVRDRTGGRNGMRVHLAWEASAFFSYFEVTTRGLRQPTGFDPDVQHGDLTCSTNGDTCSIFFPFTSVEPTMNGRQYHQVIYMVRGYGFLGAGAPAELGPLTGNGDRVASAPQNVQVQANWKSVTVSWDEPADFGSAGFATNYLVQAQPGRRVCIVTVTTVPAGADSRRCTFNNLKSRVDYTFTVQALTLNGWGATSEPTAPVAQLDLQATSALRTRPFFSFPGTTRIRVSGVASGYAPGTRLRTFMEIGTAGWREVRDANVRVDSQGRILFTRTISPLYARRTVGVRFEIDTQGRCFQPHASAGTCGQSNTEVMRRV